MDLKDMIKNGDGTRLDKFMRRISQISTSGTTRFFSWLQKRSRNAAWRFNWRMERLATAMATIITFLGWAAITITRLISVIGMHTITALLMWEWYYAPAWHHRHVGPSLFLAITLSVIQLLLLRNEMRSWAHHQHMEEALIAEPVIHEEGAPEHERERREQELLKLTARLTDALESFFRWCAPLIVLGIAFVAKLR